VNILKKYIFLVFIPAVFSPISAMAQQAGIPGAGELEISLQKLNVLGSVLYVGAHPDDENTAVLAYLSKGRKYRTAYLSVTRGEGGQNLIGPEQGAETGLIRTQELLAARRIDGAEQFFTRAVDFGYSKTAEETFEFWGKEKTLGDIVWVIRKFRPDVIMSRFSARQAGGHGHHMATASLVKEAFAAAGDPGRFPEQLKYVSAWKPRRLLWNIWRPSQEEAKNLLRVDTGEYNPLLGKSYSEIAGESRSQHKSQGFGSAGRRGTQPDYFEIAAGDPATQDIFEGIDVSWNRVPSGQNVKRLLAKSLASFDPRQASNSIAGLIGVYAELTELPDEDWVRIKKKELLRIIQACAGLWMEAIAGDYAAAPGDTVQIKAAVINRSVHPFTFHSLGWPGIAPDSSLDLPLKNNELQSIETTIHLPGGLPFSQPYWLEESNQKGLSAPRDGNLLGQAENPPAVSALIKLQADGQLLEYSVPVLFRWTDQVSGELYRHFEVRPRITVQPENKVRLFSGDGSKKIRLRLKSHSPDVSGVVRLNGAAGWKIAPASIPFSLPRKFDETEVVFEVSPPKHAAAADLTAEAEVAAEKISRAIVEISYPHIHQQVYFPESRLRVVKIDIRTEGKRLGYVMGAGDEVSRALENLGYEVIEVSDEMLENADLSPLDAIITGVRAYDTRETLKKSTDKLLRYVEDGGTLVVQYNVAWNQAGNQIGPYPLTIGRDRVSVEDAPVVFLLPDHPLLNFPNRITPGDFEGWIQERGLYFGSQWDEKYEAVLSSHDPGEPDQKGGLLYARYGKGVFIYTGYSWFRQLPAGVPGAFRLFANMISAGKAAERSADGKN
jgi:LmbE family N-acetylglucosaminyl deacetylase